MKIGILAALLSLMAAPTYAGPCDSLSQEECKNLIQDVGRAISWLEAKQAKDPEGTEAAFQECKARSGTGVDVSVVLNCMLEIVGP